MRELWFQEPAQVGGVGEVAHALPPREDDVSPLPNPLPEGLVNRRVSTVIVSRQKWHSRFRRLEYSTNSKFEEDDDSLVEVNDGVLRGGAGAGGGANANLLSRHHLHLLR